MEHLVKKVQCENDAESFIQLMELNRQSMLKVARKKCPPCAVLLF